jgi:hypothetical protein
LLLPFGASRFVGVAALVGRALVGQARQRGPADL